MIQSRLPGNSRRLFEKLVVEAIRAAVVRRRRMRNIASDASPCQAESCISFQRYPFQTKLERKSAPLKRNCARKARRGCELGTRVLLNFVPAAKSDSAGTAHRSTGECGCIGEQLLRQLIARRLLAVADQQQLAVEAGVVPGEAVNRLKRGEFEESFGIRFHEGDLAVLG
jgi:hypothetical protein